MQFHSNVFIYILISCPIPLNVGVFFPFVFFYVYFVSLPSLNIVCFIFHSHVTTTLFSTGTAGIENQVESIVKTNRLIVVYSSFYYLDGQHTIQIMYTQRLVPLSSPRYWQHSILFRFVLFNFVFCNISLRLNQRLLLSGTQNN